MLGSEVNVNAKTQPLCVTASQQFLSANALGCDYLHCQQARQAWLVGLAGRF